MAGIVTVEEIAVRDTDERMHLVSNRLHDLGGEEPGRCTDLTPDLSRYTEYRDAFNRALLDYYASQGG